MNWDLEELARRAHEQADVGAPVNADRLAHRLGLVVRDGGPGCEGVLIGHRIFVDEGLRPERRAFAIAHEIAHHLQRTAGFPDTERSANYLGSALLLPRDDFERDLRRVGWHLAHLRKSHPAASHEALARRIVALRDARAVVFDRPHRGQLRWYAIPSESTVPDAEENEAAHEAFACGTPIDLRAGLSAWPVIEPKWARVIVVRAL